MSRRASTPCSRPTSSPRRPPKRRSTSRCGFPNYGVTDVGNPLFAFGAIRGIGTLGLALNPFDTAIGHALNGTPISLYAATQHLLDVQRVEVLRGPQNVLFGRSSEGGTVNILTAEPDGVRDVRVHSEIGTRGNYLTI